MFLNKFTLADLMWGHIEGTWERVSQYVSGAAISPLIKGETSRVSALGSLLRVTSLAQLIIHMHGLSCQNRL